MTPAEARAEFPLLETCVYLNTSSMGATPRGARDAANRWFDTLYGRWRDGVVEELLGAAHEHADDVAALIGAPPGSVTLDVNASALMARLLSALDFGERPRAVTTDREFPSVPFLLRAFRKYGCEPHFVHSARESIADAIDERTRLVVVTHASYETGELTDLAPIVARARRMGALVAVDAYQTIGVVPIDVTAMDADAVFGGAHKWLCGAWDSAFAYVRPSLLATLEPAFTGWIAGRDAFTFRESKAFADGARRFAGGTPALLPPMLSRDGLRIIRSLGVDRIRARSLELTSRVLARAKAAGLRSVTPEAPSRRAGVVTLDVPDAAETAAGLVRDGFVCSHRGGVRISPHVYNTEAEVDAFMDALIARTSS